MVAPEHRGPSPTLLAALAAWPHPHYWGTADRAELVLIRPTTGRRSERWPLYVALFTVTIICSLGAGAALLGTFHPTGGQGLTGTVLAGLRFFPEFLMQPPAVLLSGWSFALPLLTILLVHELGHYVAAHRYAIDASPPYFLPIPPTVSPIGSLGAFLRLRSPVVDRRQLLDVGAAGPLAGFVVVLAVLAWGYATSTAVPQEVGHPGSFIRFAGNQIGLGDSILTKAFRLWFLPSATAVHLSPAAFAGWAGALITGLNLLPLSQLDGGHVAYGLLGRGQRWLGLMTLLALVWLSQEWSSWLVWVVLTLMLGGWRWTHPSVLCPGRPAPTHRRILGWLCIVILVLTFVPVPIIE
jgi:membrane-associated protease RseP (regulator of RpoE activity)